jgi:hypothetical protein
VKSMKKGTRTTASLDFATFDALLAFLLSRTRSSLGKALETPRCLDLGLELQDSASDVAVKSVESELFLVVELISFHPVKGEFSARDCNSATWTAWSISPVSKAVSLAAYHELEMEVETHTLRTYRSRRETFLRTGKRLYR